VTYTIEPAASGRAKCRGCGKPIARGELRLGARLPNPFVEGELTLWFHLTCGAYKRPEAYLDAARETKETIANAQWLEEQAKLGLEHERLPRLDGCDRAPTGRAACRSCREAIEKGTWRIALVYYDEVEGRFSPGGYVHPKCAREHFGTTDVLERVRHFAPDLEADDVEEIRAALLGG
jgi:hypothetical protein